MPSAPGYKRDYDQEHKTAKKRGEYDENLARNRNRTRAIKEGKVKRHDGKDVAHKKAVSRGGSLESKSNLSVQKAGTNRSFKRRSDGSMK